MLSLVAIAVGCGAGPSTNGSGTEGNNIAQFDLGNDHFVTFFRSDSGKVLLSESAKVGDATVLSAELKSLSDVYTFLAPKGAVLPAEVVIADQNVRNRQLVAAELSSSAPVVSSGVGRSDIVEPATASDQNWAFNHVCHNNGTGAIADGTARLCLQGWSWANSGSYALPQFNNYYTAWTVIGSESTVSATFQGYNWACRGVFGNSCAWRQEWNVTVSPGYWHYVKTYGEVPKYSDTFYSTVYNVGNATITLADAATVN